MNLAERLQKKAEKTDWPELRFVGKQHGYENAIANYTKPPYPVTERDRTGQYGYYPQPVDPPKRRPRPESQRPRISARTKMTMENAA